MTAIILADAEDDLEHAFDYYFAIRRELALNFLDQYRHGVNRALEHPGAWQSLDDTYRRYRLHRFPYGIVYRIDQPSYRIVIVAVMHLSQSPAWWRSREPR
jgi:toxin ParE1/3/4